MANNIDQRVLENEGYQMKKCDLSKREQPKFQITSSTATKHQRGRSKADDFETVVTIKHNNDDTDAGKSIGANKRDVYVTPSSTYAALIPRNITTNSYEIVKPKTAPSHVKQQSGDDIDNSSTYDATRDKDRSKKGKVMVLVSICFGILLFLLLLISCAVIVIQQKNIEVRLDSRIVLLENMLATANARITATNKSFMSRNMDFSNSLDLFHALHTNQSSELNANLTYLEIRNTELNDTLNAEIRNNLDTDNRLQLIQQTLNTSIEEIHDIISVQQTLNTTIEEINRARENDLNTTGVTYIRWGRTSCPDTEETEVLYQGKAAGTLWNQTGGGSNYLCLTDDPVPLPFTAGNQSIRNYIYAEFESPGSNDQYNVSCVACYSSVRSTKIMIPGTINCSSSWTREYYGYLMAENNSHASQMSYECVDVNAERIEGTEGNTGGAPFYFTEIMCNGPLNYQEGMAVSCVVCTK